MTDYTGTKGPDSIGIPAPIWPDRSPVTAVVRTFSGDDEVRVRWAGDFDIDTGSGDDFVLLPNQVVYYVAASRTAPILRGSTETDLGDGNDLLLLGSISGTHDGGDGFDTLDLRFIDVIKKLRIPHEYITSSGKHGVRVDLEAGTVTGSVFTNVQVVAYDKVIWSKKSPFEYSHTISGFEAVKDSYFDDTLLGSKTLTGYERFTSHHGADRIDGRGGIDVVDFEGSSAIDASLKTGVFRRADGESGTLANIEGLTGSYADDVLVGDAGDNQIDGRSGADTLDGGGGIDLLSFYFAGFDTGATKGAVVDLKDGTAVDPSGATDKVRNFENVRGSHRADTIRGDNRDNRLLGLAGDDVLNGRGGDDYLEGGEGKDRLFGGAGDDQLFASLDGEGDELFGNAGKDVLFAGNNDATLDGGGGDDDLRGRTGNDSLIGGAGNDTMTGGGGDDTIDGGKGRKDYLYFTTLDPAVGITLDIGAGTAKDAYGGSDTFSKVEIFGGTVAADRITAGDGAVTIHGFDGNDVINGGKGDDTVYGGDGDDEINGRRGLNTLRGEGGNDTIRGGGATDNLNGGGGDDEILGGGGDDLILGDTNDKDPDAGNDTIFGGDGKDTIYGYGGGDTIDGGDHKDTIYGGDGKDKLLGGRGNDTLNGGDQKDILDGGAGDDILNGGKGDDTLKGGADDDVFIPGPGVDIINGGGGFDSLYLTEATSSSIVDLSSRNFDGGGFGKNSIRGVEQVFGSDYAEKITGTRKDEKFFGGGGKDILTGGGGADELVGGAGRDTLRGGNGADTLIGDSGGANGKDTLEGGAGRDSLFGRGGNDLLKGGSGRDELNGGTGNDKLWGGTGSDRFVFSEGRDVIHDFELGLTGDTLDLKTGPVKIANYAELTAAHRMDGDDLIIEKDGHSITLKNTLWTDFTAVNFDTLG